jgi:TPR repeat protein
MTARKYFLPILLLVCFGSAASAQNTQGDTASKSFLSPGKVLQKMYSKDAETGNAIAQFELGFLYYSATDGAEQDFEKAREWLEKAANQNHSKAQLLLSSIYQSGLGTTNNRSEAMRWLERAVEKKKDGKAYNLESNQLAIAYFSLGQCFFGRGGDSKKNSDFDKAFSSFLKAAELGHPIAQVQVGIFYGLGLSVKEDQSEALKWYEKAARQGEFQGFLMLGEHYKKGKGVPQNYVEAYKWYNLAAAVSNVRAESPVTMDTIGPLQALKVRDELAKQMTPEQIAEGQKRTEKFWAEIKK